MPEIFYWAPDAACMWIPCKLDPSCHSMDLDNKATEVKVNPVIDKQFSLPTQSTKPHAVQTLTLRLARRPQAAAFCRLLFSQKACKHRDANRWWQKQAGTSNSEESHWQASSPVLTLRSSWLRWAGVTQTAGVWRRSETQVSSLVREQRKCA